LVSQFSISAVTTPTANVATVAFGSTITVTANFTGTGSRFLSRIGSRAANFTWSTPANLTLTTDNGYSRVYTNAFNPGSTSCSSPTTRTVTVTLADGFNLVATNYNTALTTAAFTVYSPPKPTATPGSGTVPPRPCVAGSCGARCSGATYTVAANAGTYNGVTGSVINFYLGGSLIHTQVAPTHTYTYTGLCGNTTYSGYVTNNFNCQSDSFSFTTPTYI
jgi:hypothetical protein